MSRDERELTEFLLDADFPGRDELRDQLAHALARESSQTDYVQFEVDRSQVRAAAVVRRTPVLAFGKIIPYEVLLFVDDDGYLEALEVIRMDGEKVAARPHPAELRLEPDATPDPRFVERWERRRSSDAHRS